MTAMGHSAWSNAGREEPEAGTIRAWSPWHVPRVIYCQLENSIYSNESYPIILSFTYTWRGASCGLLDGQDYRYLGYPAPPILMSPWICYRLNNSCECKVMLVGLAGLLLGTSTILSSSEFNPYFIAIECSWTSPCYENLSLNLVVGTCI